METKRRGRRVLSEEERIRSQEERTEREYRSIEFTNLLNTRQAACYISMSQSWLQIGRMKGREKPDPGRRYLPCPPCLVFPNGGVRYKKDDLDKWIEKYGKKRVLGYFEDDEDK